MIKHSSMLLVYLLVQMGSFAQTLSYKHFTVTSNLPSNICYKVIQDEKNYIWIATEKGIVIYNGYDFKPLPIKNKLLNLDIWGLFTDIDNRVWLKSKERRNIFYYRNTIYEIDPSYQIIPGYATHMLIFKKNADDFSIYKLNTAHKLERISIPSTLKEIIIHAEENRQLVQYVNDEKQITLLLSTGKFVTYSHQTKKLEVESKYDSTNYLGHSSVFNSYHKKSFYFSADDSFYVLEGNRIKAVSSKVKGVQNIIGCTANNFFCVQNDQLKIYDKHFKGVDFCFPQFESSISQIYEDKEQNLWIVTIGNGIYFISNQALKNKVYQKAPGLLDNNILSIDLINNKLLVGYYSQSKVQEISDNKISSIEKGNGIVNHIIGLKNGDMLVSDTYVSNDLIKIVGNKINIKPIALKKGLHKLNLSVKSAMKVSDTSIFIGSLNKLLLLRKSNRILYVDSICCTASTIYSIFRFRNSILIGTSDGLYLFENNKVRYLGQSIASLKSNIRSIVVDKQDRIWIASDLENVTCYDAHFNKIRVYQEFDGLITDLYIDTFSNSILASSSNGLYKVNVDKLEEFERYSISDGLPSNEVNSTRADQNYLYVATSNGLAKILKARNNSKYEFRLLVEKLSVNSKDRNMDSPLQLKYNKDHIRIELAALSYQSFGQITYYYRLQTKGKDATWYNGRQRNFEFFNLESGDYIFEAYARDVNGIKSNEIQIRFAIIPPFWRTTWFYFLASALFVALIISVFYYRFKQSKEREIKDITIQRRFAELRLNALQSQLNSHFIYNSLNAIQGFILQKDEITASEYMNKFAKLIRLFLESSRSKAIPIEKEIELISIYTLLEKLRFGNKFDVHISAEELLDKRSYFPTNLLQPYVENAINHGLIHKKEGGNLYITFSDTKDAIHCKIEDDGIGRQASKEMQKNKKRKSYGMEIIQDKIANIENLLGHKIEIEIIDKYPPEYTTPGTIVTIHINKSYDLYNY
ncbi:MAG: histidine kinase [Bacteroidetes bacterium]|nr:histidine kinase [Bacteroidota bacterium]